MKPPKKHPSKSKKNSPAMTDIEIGSDITTRKARRYEFEGELVTSSGLPYPGGLAEYDHNFGDGNRYEEHSEEQAAYEAATTLAKAGITYDPTKEGPYMCRIVRHVESLGHKPFDSAVWYAAAIYQYFIFATDAIKENNSQRAAWFGFHLGQYYAEGRLKEGWGRDAISGRKTRALNKNKGKQGGAVKAAKAAPLHERIKACAVKLRVKSKWGKAEILARQFQLSAERIRKII